MIKMLGHWIIKAFFFPLKLGDNKTSLFFCTPGITYREEKKMGAKRRGVAEEALLLTSHVLGQVISILAFGFSNHIQRFCNHLI